MLSLSDNTYKQNYWWLLISVFVIALDQVTKQLAQQYLHDLGSVSVTGFFNLTLLHNRGAAFSFLSQAGGWQHGLFSLLSITISTAIVIALARVKPQARVTLLGLTLVVGGALGNLWDRLHYGYVIDFLHFHWNHWHFAVFNLADSAISCGAALLVLAIIREE